ncbi:MAG: 2-succinyl-5-enolpyruvyl-6-hydroxy-3-cyclohexene-1-carboxylic-acid synthase [Myxococcota bacterium]|nr:2-succinyl-5-enolpyruvyl-6-hydroxy-3-cyclohexene-1-carboxylic-acid synthase [Myxococcota bacterium]
MNTAALRPMNQAWANAWISAAIIAEIVEQGVKLAVLSPGSRNTPLALALADCPQVEVKVVLDERSAGFFALGVARASQRPVVLACTSGSALANYYPAVVEAFHSEIPLVLLTADRPSELQGRGAPQTMKQPGFFGSFAKVCMAIDAPEPEAPVNLDRLSDLGFAIRTARTAPQGPVHVNCGFRKPLWDPQTERQVIKVPKRDYEQIIRDTTEQMTDAFVDLVARSTKGVFVCGPDAFKSSGDASKLYELADGLGWPVLAEASSGARYGHSHSSLFTHYDAAFRTPHAIPEPDCIVRFGRACTSQWLANWIRDCEHAAWIVIHDGQTCVDPERHHDHYFEVSPAILVDKVVARRFRTAADPDWLSQWTQLETTCQSALDRDDLDLFWEGSVASICVEHQPNGSAIHVANSMPIRDLDAFGGRTESELTIFVNRGLNGIDGTIATAVGEQVGLADARLLLLVGDLAFRHDANSLALCRDTKLTIVVNDNGGGQIFRFLPISEHKRVFEELFLTPSKIEVEALCRGYGLRCTIVETNDELKTALANEQDKSDSGVIIARIDPELNYKQHHAMWQRVRDQLAESSP